MSKTTARKIVRGDKKAIAAAMRRMRMDRSAVDFWARVTIRPLRKGRGVY